LDQETRAAYRGSHPPSRQRVELKHAPTRDPRKRNNPNTDEIRTQTISVFLYA
jgi:hypothetical protein